MKKLVVLWGLVALGVGALALWLTWNAGLASRPVMGGLPVLPVLS